MKPVWFGECSEGYNGFVQGYAERKGIDSNQKREKVGMRKMRREDEWNLEMR